MSLYYILSSKANDSVLTSVKSAIGEGTPIEIPKLVVGTLDNLMAIADEFAKYDPLIENIVRRIAQQHRDLIEKKPDLSVKGATPDDYLTHFSWEHEKYATSAPLRVNFARIQSVFNWLLSFFSWFLKLMKNCVLNPLSILILLEKLLLSNVKKRIFIAFSYFFNLEQIW